MVVGGVVRLGPARLSPHHPSCTPWLRALALARALDALDARGLRGHEGMKGAGWPPSDGSRPRPASARSAEQGLAKCRLFGRKPWRGRDWGYIIQDFRPASPRRRRSAGLAGPVRWLWRWPRGEPWLMPWLMPWHGGGIILMARGNDGARTTRREGRGTVTLTLRICCHVPNRRAITLVAAAAWLRPATTTTTSPRPEARA